MDSKSTARLREKIAACIEALEAVHAVEGVPDDIRRQVDYAIDVCKPRRRASTLLEQLEEIRQQQPGISERAAAAIIGVTPKAFRMARKRRADAERPSRNAANCDGSSAGGKEKTDV